jgi:hypothetical protein
VPSIQSHNVSVCKERLKPARRNSGFARNSYKWTPTANQPENHSTERRVNSPQARQKFRREPGRLPRIAHDVFVLSLSPELLELPTSLRRVHPATARVHLHREPFRVHL